MASYRRQKQRQKHFCAVAGADGGRNCRNNMHNDDDDDGDDNSNYNYNNTG